MTYSLKGDRGTEYSFTVTHLPHSMKDGWALDIGPGTRARVARYAIDRGWHVVGIDLMPCGWGPHKKFVFIQGDFLTRKFERQFNLVLNISSIEHFGVPGRYGVKGLDFDADLRAMRKMRGLMTPQAQMILTLPVGLDAMMIPFHRVYGEERLPLLLEGYQIVVQRYWAKFNNVDVFKETTRDIALNTKPLLTPAHYYAVGGFILEKKQ